MQYPFTNDLKAHVFPLHVDLEIPTDPINIRPSHRAGLWARYQLTLLPPVSQLGHQGNSDREPWGFVFGCPPIVDIRQLAKLGVGP